MSDRIKLFKWDKRNEVGENIVNNFVPVLIAVIILIIYLSAFGILNNFYADACRAAKPGLLWKGLGLICTAIWVIQVVRLVKDDDDYGQGSYPLMFVFIALSFAAFSGFAYPYWSQ